MARKRGYKHTEETKEKMRLAKLGTKQSEEHKLNRKKTYEKRGYPNCKGDFVGKYGVHAWLKKLFGKPTECEHCGRTDKKKYEWACKDHKYTRDKNNYMRLCTSCHRKYDYEHNGYKSYEKLCQTYKT